MAAEFDDYALALDQLRMLAQQDLADWWANTDGLKPHVRMDTLREAFHAVQSTYGEQAAYLAADYLFLQRSLDESLAGLEFPAVAEPAAYEQARAGFNWATAKYRESFDPALLAVAKDKLSGVLNRLVAQPAHDTIADAVVDAGTGYARVPEPGACSFCLMLASRGAVYSKESVQSANGYHDNCRCVGVEVKSDADLPRINRELHELWQSTSKKLEDTPTNRQFQEAVIRYRNKTPDWIPFSAERVKRAPRSNRGRKSSVLSAEELYDLNTVDSLNTRRDTQPNKLERETWDKEQRIIDWILSADVKTEVLRVGRPETINPMPRTPDFIVNGATTDGKTASLRKLESHVSSGSGQAEQVIFDARGNNVTNAQVRRALSAAAYNHGDRLERIVVVSDDSVHFWER